MAELSDKEIKKLAVRVLIGSLTIEDVRKAYGDEVASRVIAIINSNEEG